MTRNWINRLLGKPVKLPRQWPHTWDHEPHASMAELNAQRPVVLKLFANR
jgi:hypothetical protein